MGPGGLGTEAFGIVPGGDQQCRGAVDTDAVERQQVLPVFADEPAEQPVDVLRFGLERHGPLAESPQRGLGGEGDRIRYDPGSHGSCLLGQRAARNTVQGWRISFGAVKPRWRIWFMVLIRDDLAERLATTSARIASTLPSRVLAWPSWRSV